MTALHPTRWLLPLLVLALATGCTTWENSGWDDDDAEDDDGADDDDTVPGDDDDHTDDDDDVTDDDDDGDPNHPPTAPEIHVEPPVAMTDEDLSCVIDVESTDINEDAIHYAFAWTEGGNPAAITQPTLPSNLTSEGESWTCTVTPNDGQQDGSFAEASAYVSGPDPYGYTMDIRIAAAGGAAGGTADVWFGHQMINPSLEPICTIEFEFAATYTYGTNQGDDYWGYIDEVITWTSGGQVDSDCPASWEVFTTDPISEWMWFQHPHAFVSCEQVAADTTLANTYLGMDDAGWMYATTGTFQDFCDNVGPVYETAYATGPIEGLWLTNGAFGTLDTLGTFGYFAPPSHDNVDYWLVMGLLMTDPANANEPTTGLRGTYIAHPFWYWIYMS
jgi:hypothetical protein